MAKKLKIVEEANETALVTLAKDLLDGITSTIDISETKEMNETRYKEMKLVLGYANLYLKAHQVHQKYYILENIPQKLGIIKRYSERLRIDR